MKFPAIISIIVLALGSVSAYSISTVTSTVGENCSVDKHVCIKKTECCGVAKKDAAFTSETNYAKDGVSRTVCNTASATTLV